MRAECAFGFQPSGFAISLVPEGKLRPRGGREDRVSKPVGDSRLSWDVKSGPLETLPTIPGQALRAPSHRDRRGPLPCPWGEMEAGSRLCQGVPWWGHEGE